MSRLTRRRSVGARSRSHRGSAGALGLAGAPGPAGALGFVRLVGRVGSSVGRSRRTLIRAASGDAAGPASRAVPIASLAAPRLPNGPRTNARPRSSVCSASTTAQVPDCGSIVKRSSRVCQRPPPSRLRDSSLSVDLTMASKIRPSSRPNLLGPTPASTPRPDPGDLGRNSAAHRLSRPGGACHDRIGHRPIILARRTARSGRFTSDRCRVCTDRPSRATSLLDMVVGCTPNTVPPDARQARPRTRSINRPSTRSPSARRPLCSNSSVCQVRRPRIVAAVSSAKSRSTYRSLT